MFARQITTASNLKPDDQRGTQMKLLAHGNIRQPMRFQILIGSPFEQQRSDVVRIKPDLPRAQGQDVAKVFFANSEVRNRHAFSLGAWKTKGNSRPGGLKKLMN